ncbi:uncharacterized protein [Lolium perenne]|uniref:uncharacterized protein n=1 Tax=Lolium perenne TaxID=4522 RepID=UPI003A98FDD0
MDVGYSGFDSGPNHVDPDRVFALVASRRPGDLAGYLASIPGATEDAQCRLANSAGLALLDPTLRSSWPPQPDEDSWIQYLAQYARTQALMSSADLFMLDQKKNV